MWLSYFSRQGIIVNYIQGIIKLCYQVILCSKENFRTKITDYRNRTLSKEAQRRAFHHIKDTSLPRCIEFSAACRLRYTLGNVAWSRSDHPYHCCNVAIIYANRAINRDWCFYRKIGMYFTSLGTTFFVLDKPFSCLMLKIFLLFDFLFILNLNKLLEFVIYNISLFYIVNKIFCRAVKFSYGK